MMGRQAGDQSQLFYLFNLEERIPARHLLRRINPIATRVLGSRRRRSPPGSQAAQGDLADGSLLGVDGKGEQARPVWLWPQLHD
jgi:hypothetical protein